MNLWIALQPCQIWQIFDFLSQFILSFMETCCTYTCIIFFINFTINCNHLIKSIRTTVVCIYLVYVENGYPVWVSRINSFIITIIWFNLKTAVASSLHWINAKLIPVFIFTYCPDFSIFRLNKRNLKNRILYVCR